MYSIDDLRPIIERVRTDITAKKMADGTSIWCKNEPLTSERIQAHLSGNQLRGVCPIKEGENTAMLALLDLDSHKGETSWDDMLQVAQNIYDEASKYGIYFEGFHSSGGKGVHLISIWDEAQDAYSVRQLFVSILESIGYKNGAGGVAKKEVEVFPKQDKVSMGGCGNQFILPFSPKGVPIAEVQWLRSKPVPVLVKPAPQPKSYANYDDKDEMAEAVSALKAISPDIAYPEWVAIGMGLKDKFGNAGFQLWDTWSSGGVDYESSEMWKKWQSFNNEGITIATMFDIAMLNGWKHEPTLRPEVDVSITENIVGQIAGKKSAMPKKSEFNFDPMKIDGLIGDTVRWIVRDTLLPQPMLALLNTLAFAGSVFGRRYASPLDTRSNIYFIGVADTGAGKDNSRKRIGKLAEAAGLGDFVGAHSIRSDTGMVRSLQKYPCQLLMLDEFGKFLQALTDNKASPHNKAVIRAFMQLYGDSAGVYKHGDYANPKVNESIVIHNPNLCIYGTTTEGEYLKALSYDAVKSGELNRMIAIKVPTVERVRVTCIPFLEPELVDRWSLFSPNSLGIMLNDASLPPEPTIVEWGDCDDLQWEIGGYQYDAGRNNPQTAALWNRRHENITKIAMIFAIARNKTLPEFKKVDFDIAKSIVDASIHYMCGLIGENLAENDYEKSYVEILEFFKQNSPNGITRTQLFKRFRKFKRKELDEFLSGMIEQEVLIAERETGKTKPILTYKLKD